MVIEGKEKGMGRRAGSHNGGDGRVKQGMEKVKKEDEKMESGEERIKRTEVISNRCGEKRTMKKEMEGKEEKMAIGLKARSRGSEAGSQSSGDCTVKKREG